MNSSVGIVVDYYTADILPSLYLGVEDIAFGVAQANWWDYELPVDGLTNQHQLSNVSLVGEDRIIVFIRGHLLHILS